MFVELKNINKNFGNFKASDNVSFSIEKGVLAALLGPSGSGKTTILRMIAGLEHPDSGDIFIDGVRVNNVEPGKREIGFVFQNYALFRYMTVFDNIAFGLTVQHKAKKAITARVSELLELIGLNGMEKRYPAQLSGGQKQRVAFARALAPSPRLLLLDEPFAAIDAKVRQELRTWLRNMISHVGITSIFVTHDQDEAIEVADDIIVTNHGQIEQKGSPLDLYKAPSTPFVASFIGDSAPITLIGRLKGFERASEQSGAIRPEFIKIFADDEPIQYETTAEDAVVEDISFRGDSLRVGLKVKDVPLFARYSLEKKPIAIGDKVRVVIYRLYAFENGQATLLSNSSMGENAQGYSFSI